MKYLTLSILLTLLAPQTHANFCQSYAKYAVGVEDYFNNQNDRAKSPNLLKTLSPSPTVESYTYSVKHDFPGNSFESIYQISLIVSKSRNGLSCDTLELFEVKRR